MGGKYSAEWWEKIADLNRDLPAQDPVSVVDHLIQATAHGARTPAKNGKPSGQNPAASKRERSLADWAAASAPLASPAGLPGIGGRAAFSILQEPGILHARAAAAARCLHTLLEWDEGAAERDRRDVAHAPGPVDFGGGRPLTDDAER